jgi:hypothetical protein
MVETLRIDITGQIIDISYKNLDSLEIESESIVGDTVFVKNSSNSVFSVKKEKWFIYKRDKKLRELLD